MMSNKVNNMMNKWPILNWVPFQEKYYENGAFDHGEIERILTEVLNKIEVKFYGKVGEKKSLMLRDPNQDKPHESKHCQNCANGICRFSRKPF